MTRLCLLLIGVCLVASLAAQEPPVQVFAERDGRIVMEAEDAQGMKGYTVASDPNAVGGAYAQSGSKITFRVFVLSRGRWTIHLRCKAKDDKANSCYLKVNGRSVQAPPGVEHHTGVIQTQIGAWGWFTKWRETPNISVTVDLEPGFNELEFSPREPQFVDRIVMRLGSFRKWPKIGFKFQGEGPAATPHFMTVPWPEDGGRDLQQLTYQLRGGQLGAVITKLERAAKRDEGLSDAQQQLLDLAQQWVTQRLELMEAAEQAGDFLGAVDHATVLAQVAKGDPRLRAIGKRVQAWKKEDAYKAGQVLYRILLTKDKVSGEEFEKLISTYKQKFPNSPYLTKPYYFSVE